MEDRSIFLDKEPAPTEKDLAEKLGATHQLWQAIQALVVTKYPKAIAEWNFSGKKYGWSFRIKDKKRAIIYLLPRDQFFKVAFVFGDKAFHKIMNSTVAQHIKDELSQSTKYAEGRGLRIDVTDKSILPDIALMIDIKLDS